ncbi:MAG: hypothetical protein JNL83_19430 [Myxococcales bacterium]|nr:hypothetical protein [Myxococcales bacterium]
MRLTSFVIALGLVACAKAEPPAAREVDAPPPQIDAPAIDSPMIDAQVCATSPCDIQTQCGCDQTMACDVDFSDLMGTACRPKTDTGVEGTNCGGTFGSPQKCAKGYICIGSGNDRSCNRYCATNADCLSPRGQCVIQITANGMAIPGATTCSSNCDPATTTNPLCPTGWSCDLFTATFMGTQHKISDCRAAGTAAQGATCSATVPCAAGLTCVTLSTGGTRCAKICKPPSNTGCPTGTTCGGFSTPFTIAGTEYGACL